MDPQEVRIVVDSEARNNSSSVRWWHLVIIVLAVAVGWKLWKAGARVVREKRTAKLCLNSPRVVVLLHCFREAPMCARTIMSLLRTAACRDHVSFWVYQELDYGDMDVFRACMEIAQTMEERLVVERVRIVTVDNASEAGSGSLFAWSEMLSRASDMTQAWVLLTTPGTAGTPDWDVHLLQQSNRGSVLTCVPPSIDGPAALSASIDGTVGGIARDWMRNMAASHEHTARIQHQQMPTFPVVGEMNGYFPEISSRTFPLMPREPVEVLMATCGCLFAPLHLLKHVLVPLRDFVVADYALDWIVSTALWSREIHMLAPACAPPLVRVERARTVRPAAWKSKEMLMKLLKNGGKGYAEFAGVDLSEGECFGRGRMGLLPSMSDVLVKFGSQAAFDRVKRMWTRESIDN